VSNFSNAEATQRSRALYVRDEIRAGKARVAAGARREFFDKDFNDPLGFPTTTYNSANALTAWELQGSYALMSKLDVFAKAGKSYRMPNVDDNAFTPQANQPLQPQTSRDTELGMSLGDAQRKVTVKWFQHRLKNEILFDPNQFANVNLDPTRRQGVEIEGAAQLASSLRLSVNLQHVEAEFTGGPNAGREVVLVPRNTAALRLNWEPGAGHIVNAGVQWADSQRYGGDFNNGCAARIPSYATLDARYAYRTGAWEFALAGTNLADRQYFSTAFGACQNGIYPDMGRQIKASARLSF
jgi:iron complex outermembrane receptor protein